MDGLISRAAAIEEMRRFSEIMHDNRCKPSWYDAVRIVKDMPDVDAAPLVHARWSKARFEKTYAGYTKASIYYVCSACGKDVDDALFNYCPKCGAKMERREGE